MTTATTTKAKAPKTAAKAAPAAEPEVTEPAAETVEAAAAPAPAAAIEQVVKASQDAAAKGIEQVLAAAKDPVEAAQKAQAQVAKSSEEALAAAKENLDAVLKAGNLLSKGLQDLTKSVVVLTQEVVEENLANSKKLLTAKTLHEAVDLHSAHAKAQIDRMVAEGARISEASLKLFEEALAPIQARVHSTVEKLTKLNRH
ncbi:MAG TPA: phasin family protein [Magnetospirillum sp.]|nr:phasin family protein [Magnetospirillum sp.]